MSDIEVPDIESDNESDEDCLCSEEFQSFDCIQNQLDGGDSCKYHPSDEDEN
jgi:hypothetical protein